MGYVRGDGDAIGSHVGVMRTGGTPPRFASNTVRFGIVLNLVVIDMDRVYPTAVSLRPYSAAHLAATTATAYIL